MKKTGLKNYRQEKKEMTIFDAASKYIKNNIDTIVVGGIEYGSRIF